MRIVGRYAVPFVLVEKNHRQQRRRHTGPDASASQSACHCPFVFLTLFTLAGALTAISNAARQDLLNKKEMDDGPCLHCLRQLATPVSHQGLHRIERTE